MASGKIHDLKRLNARHKIAAKMMAADAERADVIKKTGLSTFTLSRIQNSPLFRQELSRQAEKLERRGKAIAEGAVLKARAALEDLAMKAVDTVDELMDSKNERVKLAAAECVLDRTLPKKVEGGSGGAPTMVFNGDVIQQFQQVMRESDAMRAPVLPAMEGAAA